MKKMFSRRIRTAAIVVTALAAATQANAARPLITDDARFVDPKSCQVEAWVKRNRDSTEYWALPACNPWGNAEITLGGALTHENGSTRTTDVQAQVKTLFKPLDDDGWGIGAAIGTVHKPTRESENGLGDTYFYIPASFAIRDTPLVIHVNVGAARHQDENRNVVTWGVGSETTLSERVYLIAEVFGQGRERPFYQLGMRFWIVKDRMQVDMTYGNRGSGRSEDRWISIGMRLLSPAFIP